MLSSNRVEALGKEEEKRRWRWRLLGVVFLVYPYQDVLHIECTADDKYLVLWHCSNHSSDKKMGSERHKEQRFVSLKACTFGSGGGRR